MDFPNVNLDNFGEHIAKYEIKRYASVYDNIPLLNTFPKAYPAQLFDLLNDHVDRVDSLDKLNRYTKDMDTSNMIEAGIYEFALLYSYKNNLNKDFISSVYNDKLAEILENLNRKSSVNNRTLLSHLLNGEIDPQEIAFLSPRQMHPDNWKTEIQKKEKIEYTRANRASTNMYKCNDCGERKGIIYQIQLRSADEPMSSLYTCLVCYKTFKVS
jgi:DNA-directed RNA polymerase subunit M/transcription elongation factor TFIIS